MLNIYQLSYSNVIYFIILRSFVELRKDKNSKKKLREEEEIRKIMTQSTKD